MNDVARFSTPYKGPDSYQVEDAALFFGRGRDAERLGASILSSRLTLLHAQSGAGKTSLLNAEVIPAVERKGWIAVRVLPQNDPIASVWISTLAYVLPPVRCEYLAIDRIVKALSKPDEEPTVGELLERYDDLPMRDPHKRSLIAPIDAAEVPDAPARVQCANFTPYVCRLFRSTCDLQAVAEHFAAVMAFADGDRALPFDLGNDTPARALAAFCSSSEFARAYENLVAALDAPTPRLRELLRSLVEIYGTRRTQFSLVILLDQFEELFTRFVDLGSLAQDRQGALPDWRLKYEFFDQLRELHQIDRPEEPAADGALPIRYVISMRSEYIAQLDPIRSFAPDLDVESFRLELLDREGARQAIQSPALEYGFGYTDDCYKAISRELTKEERFVEPAHVQIVCEKLWTEQGKALSDEALRAAGDAAPDATRKIGVELYRDRLNGAAGIMRAFLDDFLDGLDRSSRLETLELLEPLITGSGTRNIIERGALVAAAFRPRQHREHLLANLVARTIARVETRLGGQFVEITHEFLIPPIREAMQKDLYADVDYTRCRVALRMLGRLQDTYSGNDARPSITSADFQLLNRYRDRIEWNDWAVSLMFREAVRLGASHDEMRLWAERFRASRSSEVAATAAEGSQRHDVAVDVIRGYLASPDDGEKRNALKALAALASHEAADMLIAVGLDTGNIALRDAAVAEFVRLGDGINGLIAEKLGANLLEPGKARQTYALLGRIRRSGSPIAVKLPRYRTRLRLSLSLFGQLYPKGKRKPWARSIRAATLGSLLPSVVVSGAMYIVILALKVLSIEDVLPPLEAGIVYVLPGMVVGIVFLIIPMIPVATRRASPFALHYDPKAGRIAELLWAAVGTFYVAAWWLLITLVSMAIVTIGKSEPIEPLGLIVVFATSAIVFVVAASVASAVPMAIRYGSMRVDRRGKTLSRRSRVVGGTLLGLIVSTVFVAGLFYFNINDAKAEVAFQNMVFLLGCSIPAAASLAYAYVTIDDEDVIKA